ncbi:MAG TPA: DUF222 domain-containing protein, partial [Acidimicrobiales bacterium]|nr:DUF222 domain-containing protein [Acidimicrobiales bacterium]
MFEALVGAIEAMEPPSHNATLVEALRLRERFEARLAIGVGAFDTSGLWELDHASSAVAWLRQQGLTAGAAVALVRAGRCVANAPLLGDAWLDGRLCGGQVQAVVANVSERHSELFAEHHAELVPTLVGLSVRETALVMQAWRARADALLDRREPRDPERSLHLSRTFGGRAELSGSLDPESATVVETALRVASTDDDEATGVRTPSERRADALVDLCQRFLDHQDTTSTTGRHRPHLNVVVDLAQRTGRTLDGVLLDTDTVRVLLCDANVHRVVTDGASTILDYGRSTRTAPPPLFTSLALRDGHCRLVNGCDRGPEWCDAHHVAPWEDGGETSLHNMVLACSRHHHLLH